jgi:hypothetical protein
MGAEFARSGGAMSALASVLECALCFRVFHDPVTLVCGHTYCRSCVRRALTLSAACPTCRAPVFAGADAIGTSWTISALVEAAVPALAQARAAEAADEEAEVAAATFELGLFVLPPVAAAAMPGCPVALFVFEPRYLVLMDRAQRGSRQFALAESDDARWVSVVALRSVDASPGGRLVVKGVVEGRAERQGAAVPVDGGFGLLTVHVRLVVDTPLTPTGDGRGGDGGVGDGGDGARHAGQLRTVVVAACQQLLELAGPHAAAVVAAECGLGPPQAVVALSHWAAAAVALSPRERTLARATRSTLARLWLVYRALARAAAPLDAPPGPDPRASEAAAALAVLSDQPDAEAVAAASAAVTGAAGDVAPLPPARDPRRALTALAGAGAWGPAVAGALRQPSAGQSLALLALVAAMLWFFSHQPQFG